MVNKSVYTIKDKFTFKFVSNAGIFQVSKKSEQKLLKYALHCHFNIRIAKQIPIRQPSVGCTLLLSVGFVAVCEFAVAATPAAVAAIGAHPPVVAAAAAAAAHQAGNVQAVG